VLRVVDLVTAYGKIEALKGVSLEVREGSITCVLGPNGAGKTTLMLTIAGVLRPRQGAIEFRGEPIAALSPHAIVARGVALVPENRLVFAHMTVLENLHAGAYQRKGPYENDLEKIFARFPRLKERASQDAGTLSGGEQQMLAVARALMSRPKLLLMDEPSLGLAPLVVEEIFRIIGVLRRANLAYGPAILFGCYCATWAYLETGIGLLFLALIAVAGSALAGIYVERLCFAPHRKGAAAAAMVASFALWMQFEELATL